MRHDGYLCPKCGLVLKPAVQDSPKSGAAKKSTCQSVGNGKQGHRPNSPSRLHPILTFTCNSCGGFITARAGQQLECPHCRQLTLTRVEEFDGRRDASKQTPTGSEIRTVGVLCDKCLKVLSAIPDSEVRCPECGRVYRAPTEAEVNQELRCQAKWDEAVQAVSRHPLESPHSNRHEVEINVSAQSKADTVVHCPACSKSFTIPTCVAGDYLNDSIACKHCGHLFRLRGLLLPSRPNQTDQPGQYVPGQEFRGLEGLTTNDVWEAVPFVVAAVVVLFFIVVFIQGMVGTGSTPEQREQGRIQREAKERIDRQNDQMLDAAREAQILLEMERLRKQGR